MTSGNFGTIIENLRQYPLYQRYLALPPLGQKLALVGSITFLVSLALTLVYFF